MSPCEPTDSFHLVLDSFIVTCTESTFDVGTVNVRLLLRFTDWSRGVLFPRSTGVCVIVFRRGPNWVQRGQPGIGCKRSLGVAIPAHLGLVIAARPRIRDMIPDATAGLLDAPPAAALLEIVEDRTAAHLYLSKKPYTRHRSQGTSQSVCSHQHTLSRIHIFSCVAQGHQGSRIDNDSA